MSDFSYNIPFLPWRESHQKLAQSNLIEGLFGSIFLRFFGIGWHILMGVLVSLGRSNKAKVLRS